MQQTIFEVTFCLKTIIYFKTRVFYRDKFSGKNTNVTEKLCLEIRKTVRRVNVLIVSYTAGKLFYKHVKKFRITINYMTLVKIYFCVRICKLGSSLDCVKSCFHFCNLFVAKFRLDHFEIQHSSHGYITNLSLTHFFT